MTTGDLDFLGHADWRKRIHQIKQELRSATPKQSRTFPEQAKPDGTELKPKRDRHSAKPASPTREIASKPSRQGRSSYSV